VIMKKISNPRELLDLAMLVNCDKTREEVARILFKEYKDDGTLSEVGFENMIRDLQ